MRFYLTGLARPKRVAQHLCALFPANNLSASQELAARLYGYRNWHEMAEITKAGGNPPSKLDEYLSGEEQTARRLDQEATIHKLLNLSESDAARVALIRQILTSRTTVPIPTKTKSAASKRKK